MAYEQQNSRGVTYYLNKLVGKTGKTIYFFSKDIREKTAAELPEGLEVIESKTGMLIVREKKA